MANGTQFADAGGVHYRLTNDIALKWNENVINSARTGTIPDGSGKRGVSVGAGIGKTVIYDTIWTVGFRVYFDSQQGWGGQGPLYQCSSANQLPFSVVSIEHDGTVSLWAGNRHTLVANSGSFGFSIHGGTSYYIEISTTIAGGTPCSAAVNLQINGIHICNGTGSCGFNDTDTLLQIPEANYHNFSDANIVNGNAWMRDFYIANILGAFYGDIGLGAVFPDANGGVSGFVGVGASPEFNCVNSQYPDINDDTIYIKAGVSGDSAQFSFQPLTGTDPIPFVHFGIYHKKDAEGTRTFVLTMDGVAVTGNISPGDDYRYDFIALDKGPGGAPWDVALFNSTVFGLRITS